MLIFALHNVYVTLKKISGGLKRNNVSANVVQDGLNPRSTVSTYVFLLANVRNSGGAKEARTELVSVNVLKAGNVTRDVKAFLSALPSVSQLTSLTSGGLKRTIVSVNVLMVGLLLKSMAVYNVSKYARLASIGGKNADLKERVSVNVLKASSVIKVVKVLISALLSVYILIKKTSGGLKRMTVFANAVLVGKLPRPTISYNVFLFARKMNSGGVKEVRKGLVSVNAL
jgi:hypothetical protein